MYIIFVHQFIIIYLLFIYYQIIFYTLSHNGDDSRNQHMYMNIIYLAFNQNYNFINKFATQLL